MTKTLPLAALLFSACATASVPATNVTMPLHTQPPVIEGPSLCMVPTVDGPLIKYCKSEEKGHLIDERMVEDYDCGFASPDGPLFDIFHVPKKGELAATTRFDPTGKQLVMYSFLGSESTGCFDPVEIQGIK
jgi:hypothetical protein